MFGGSLDLLRVGRTAHKPLTVKQRRMERRCLARHNRFYIYYIYFASYMSTSPLIHSIILHSLNYFISKN